MKRIVCALIAVAFCGMQMETFAAPYLRPDEDRILRLDSVNHLLTIRGTRNVSKSYQIDPSVEVTLNGLKATLNDLAPGMKVNLKLLDPATVRGIDATGTSPNRKRKR